MAKFSLKKIIENNTSAILVICVVIGLVVPKADCLPDELVAACVALVLFLACFKVELREAKSLPWYRLFLFWAGRFLLFPVLLYQLSHVVIPSQANTIFLLALMPVGVAAPAVTGLIKGNVALALVLCAASSLITPFVVPPVIGLFIEGSVSINSWSLFYTLALVVFTPLIIHFPLRRVSIVRDWVDRNNDCVSVLLIGLMAIVVIANRRDFIFRESQVVAEFLIILILEYLLFFLVGYLLARALAFEERMTCMTCAGINNNGLAMSVAVLHFHPLAALFVLLSEVPWLLSVITLKSFEKFKFAKNDKESL